MPELPEVETVRSILEPQLAGRTICALRALRRDVVAHPAFDAFEQAVTGAKITRVDRRGKYLLLQLAGGGQIIVHLRMTGQLYVAPPDMPLEKHTHLLFTLDNARQLRYVDTRRFGRVWALRPGEKDEYSGVQKLGPEPFDKAFTAEYLAGVLHKRRQSIKQGLLDQHVVAGIGNIYADESLHAANIHPARAASSLDDAEWQRLAQAIPGVLAGAIDACRMSEEEYLAGRGKEYRGEGYFKVYGRADNPCVNCGAPLQKMVLGGRTTCCCPSCQPPP